MQLRRSGRLSPFVFTTPGALGSLRCGKEKNQALLLARWFAGCERAASFSSRLGVIFSPSWFSPPRSRSASARASCRRGFGPGRAHAGVLIAESVALGRRSFHRAVPPVQLFEHVRFWGGLELRSWRERRRWADLVFSRRGTKHTTDLPLLPLPSISPSLPPLPPFLLACSSSFTVGVRRGADSTSDFFQSPQSPGATRKA